MAQIVPIDSADDPRLDDYRRLREGGRRQRVEAEGGFLVVEGAVAIGTLLASGLPVRSLLLVPRELERLGPALAAVDAPAYVVSRDVLAAVAGFDVHRGALATATRPARRAAGEVLAAARRVLVLEGVGDHENLGSLFRSAAGLGWDAVLLDPSCADPLYRRAVRVSLGHVLRVPSARLPPLPAGLEPARRAGFAVAALTPAEDAEPLVRVRPAPGARIALLLGAEGPGLTRGALAAADRRVRIPLASGVDSLNVAVAAAVAMHALGPSLGEGRPAGVAETEH